jgi:hypothetical protein
MIMNNYIPVDFNNCDEDGAVRLITRGVDAYIEENSIKFNEGDNVMLSDGELFAKAVLSYRDNMWVAIASDWLDDG